jgi:hypothetical protein
MKKTILAGLLALTAILASQAGTFSIYSDKLTISGINTPIAALWGSYSSGVFTPLLTSTPTFGLNTGYYDPSSGPETAVALSQNNNNTIAETTALYLSIYNRAAGLAYSSTVNQIVLSDPTWLAPAFGISSSTSVNFTANTVVNNLSGFTGGSYSFNAGTPSVALASAVPEPSTYALLAIAALGLSLSFRRRKVQA